MNTNDFSHAAPLGFPHVVAKYRKEVIDRYAGNPYIEALPELPGDLELGKALRYLPAFRPEERQLPAHVRIQMLDLLEQLVVPLPRLVRLARAVLKMLRTGYGPRSPFSKSDQAIRTALYEQQQFGEFVSVSRSDRAAQHSMALIGASGCGKSYGLRTIAALLPEVIHHPDLGVWQIPSIFVEMPYDGESLHTLASGIFTELDRFLPDANYSELYAERTGLNAQRRLAIALKRAYEHGVGMIFVDETQNQRGHDDGEGSKKRKNTATGGPKLEIPLTKLLVSASNTSHMPICFSGTLEMNAMLGPRFSKARRHAGRGSGLWLPLERSGVLNMPEEFELMLRAIWNYQWIQKPVALNQAWADLFYELTQGIPDIIVKLFESSQEAAIANKSETLTEALVRTVFADEFFATEFGIIALRDKKKALQDRVPDLCLPDPVEVAERPEKQFPAPKPGPQKKSKRPANALLEAAAAIKNAKSKPNRPSPVPAEVTDQVASEADLRGANLEPTAAETSGAR